LAQSGLSQRKLAELIGVTENDLGHAVRFDRNGRRPNEIRKMAYDYLGMEVDDDDLP
jgi:hypothetical protein